MCSKSLVTQDPIQFCFDPKAWSPECEALNWNRDKHGRRGRHRPWRLAAHSLIEGGSKNELSKYLVVNYDKMDRNQVSERGFQGLDTGMAPALGKLSFSERNDALWNTE